MIPQWLRIENFEPKIDGGNAVLSKLREALGRLAVVRYRRSFEHRDLKF